MANDNKEVLDESPEEAEEVPELQEGEEDKTDWKAIAQKNAGIAKRNATRLAKLKKASEAKVEVPGDKDKSLTIKKGFDFAEKSYMRSAGIKPEDFDLVAQYTENGKSLDDVLDESTTVGKLFQAELKERRDLKASKDAIPSGSKRATPTARDTVEYWVAKGELPPRDQKELRQKVLDAKIKAEEKKSQFSTNPIV